MSEGYMGLDVYNTLTRRKEAFTPIDPTNVRMYVCGPTVYDFAHIGNARPVIVFDVLFRLLRHLYGHEQVTYVRNITDVDDKINARALRDFGSEIDAGTLSLNEAIRAVTEKTANQFHADVAQLGCLKPTVEPRATEFVLPRDDGKADMVSLIQDLINRGHAYEAKGEILFDTASMHDYGQLSHRKLDEQQAGARIAVEAHKKQPADFVLWKASAEEEPGWDATFSIDGRPTLIRGRPGWHIECSAMSAAYLGEIFDIHGGGLDLIFPHHENEIAQSRCAHGTPAMARYWMHNGFLQVEGRKMSKSDGNFVTINELLATERFGGRNWPGEVLRLAMLMTHYRQPIDFSVEKLTVAERILDRLYRAIGDVEASATSELKNKVATRLKDDLNSWEALSELQAAADLAEKDPALAAALKGAGDLLGILSHTRSAWEAGKRASAGIDEADVEAQVEARLRLLESKNFQEADRIRNELTAQGVQLMDYKDAESGERRTRWEVKR